MPLLPALHYLGSFQRGAYLQTDNPLEELWSRVARFGIADYLRRMASTASPPLAAKWGDWGPYAVLRVRQAVEFRQGSRNAGLLARPLPLYYSFLNLLRGFLAADKQIIATPGHGLRFSKGHDLFASIATITSGTFADYLAAIGPANTSGVSLSLEDCAAAIPEIGGDYVSLDRGWTNTISMLIEAKDDGELLLRFHYSPSESEFRTSWQTWFPGLAATSTLEPSGTVLRVNPGPDTGSRDAVADYLGRHLWVNLRWSDHPLWYVLRQASGKPPLPRPAYYYMALFILGSVVRYEPELLLQVGDPDSDIGWFIGRLIDAAERYFPQLMLHWLVTEPIFV
jgi:hypothetical protein